MRGSSQPVVLVGPSGSGKRVWAEFLCQTTGGLKIYDASLNIEQQTPLTANLYIEEICDLSLDQQFELLEAIRTTRDETRFRFIVASRFNYDALKENPLVDQGVLRMWSSAILIPSLEEHIEDVPELLGYYVNWYSDHEQLPYRHFNVAAQNLLRNHHWSGDIAQLKQFVKSILTNSESEQIELHEIEQTLREVIATSEAKAGNRMQITIDMDLDLREAREAFEREYLSRHLALSGNNMTELARRVGQERTHLYRKLKSLGLQTKKQ